MGESCFLYGCFLFIPIFNLYISAKMRERIREKYGVEDTFIKDILMKCFCGFCTLVQESRELEENPSMEMARQ